MNNFRIFRLTRLRHDGNAEPGVPDAGALPPLLPQERSPLHLHGKENERFIQNVY